MFVILMRRFNIIVVLIVGTTLRAAQWFERWAVTQLPLSKDFSVRSIEGIILKVHPESPEPTIAHLIYLNMDVRVKASNTFTGTSSEV
jgi:hypothetical protein